MTPIKFLPLYMRNSGCDYHRVYLPFLCGAEYMDQTAFEGFKAEYAEYFCSQAEVVQWNRSCPIPLETMLEWKKKYGFKTVVDLDDWLYLPSYHPNYLEYEGGVNKQGQAVLSGRRRIIENLRFADLVTVTTERLYQKVKEFNPQTAIIPNALPFGHFQFQYKPDIEKPEKYNFIYAGQSSHLEDVRLLQPSMQKIRKMEVQVSMCGFQPTHVKMLHAGKAVIMRNKVTDRMDDVFRVLEPNYNRVDMLPLESYMDVYDHAHCSIAPLCFNDFNACKSNLKMLESACKKIPLIASQVPPYTDDIGCPILFAKTPTDWHKQMKYISDSKTASAEMGEELHQWALKRFHIVPVNKYRFELYDRLKSTALVNP